LVGQENQIEDVRFLFPPLTTPSVVAAKTRVQRCLCREVDEIWQYRTGGNLMTFDKDHGTAEEGLQKQGSCSQAYGFATITMYGWWHFACLARHNALFPASPNDLSANLSCAAHGQSSPRGLAPPLRSSSQSFAAFRTCPSSCKFLQPDSCLYGSFPLHEPISSDAQRALCLIPP
jgi:hypothetical protein